MEVEGPPNSHSKLDINLIKPLFKAAENGDVSLFNTLSEEQLLKALSLRNEVGRSLLHVALSFGRPKRGFYSIKEYFRFAVPSAAMICLEWWTFEIVLFISGLLPNPKLETSLLSICV